MTDERVRRADQGLLASYGRTMLSVQLFETALLRLVQINQSESTEFDEAWKQVKDWFEMTAGQLRKELQEQGVVSEDLQEEIQIAVEKRNRLAHDYLLEYRMRSTFGAVTPRKAVQEMQAVSELYQDLTVRLDALTHQRAKELGWDLDNLRGLTEEELRRIMSEL